MNPDESPVEDYEKPVAYDANSQPLYAHPAESTHEELPQAVHVTRPVDPIEPFISVATKAKHDQSKQLYPNLNLSEGEYIVTVVRRHFVGLLLPLSLGVVLVALSLSALLNYDIVVQTLHLKGPAADISMVIVPILLFILLVCLGVYMAYYIYTNNRFYLTNESVIQEIQMGLFNHREQTISLGNVEDASFVQNGIVQQALGYGELRLSTIGDENTYTFPYATHPKESVAVLNNTVESFKNGRPVDTAQVI